MSSTAVKNILICDRFAIEASIELKKNTHFKVTTQISELPTAHALVIRSKFKVTKEVLDNMGVKSYVKTSGSTGIHIYIYPSVQNILMINANYLETIRE